MIVFTHSTIQKFGVKKIFFIIHQRSLKEMYRYKYIDVKKLTAQMF